MLQWVQMCAREEGSGLQSRYIKIATLSVFTVILIVLLSVTAFAGSDSKGIILTGQLNVRDAASLDSNRVGYYYKDNEVDIISYKDGWYLVDGNGIEGWVHSWFIFVEGEPVSLANTVKSGGQLMERATSESKAITNIPNNVQLFVHGRDDDWYYVRYNDTFGWIYGEYIEVENYKIGKGQITGSYVNVRDYPDLSGNVYDTLKFGTEFEVIGRFGGWYNIEYNNRKLWVHGDYASFEPYSVSAFNNEYENNAFLTLNIVEPPRKVKTVQNAIVDLATKFLGLPYVWGGESPIYGFDCSGLVKYVYGKFNYYVPHRADLQAKYGTYIPRNELKPGDVIFFDAEGSFYIDHCGIYIGDNKFVHAVNGNLSGQQVTITELTGYYERIYIKGMRYLDY